MKKILFALLAVSMVLPMSAMADNTTVYGQFRYSIADVQDNGRLKANPNPPFEAAGFGAKDGIVAADNTSLLGVKGSYGDSVKAYFHLQMGANADDAGTLALKQRFYFGGLKGSFGNVKYGRLTNAYKMPGFKMDPLYNTSHLNVNGQYATGGASYGLSGATNGFTDNSLEYHSPKIGGVVSLNVGAYLDDSDNDDHALGLGIKVATGGFTAGAQFIANDETYAVPNTTADEAALRLHVGYKGERFSVGISREVVSTATEDPIYNFLTGTIGVTDSTDIVATIGVVDADVSDTDGTNEGIGGSISVFQGVTTGTKVFASYALVDYDGDQINEDKPSVFSIGVQHKFSTSN